MSHATLAEPTPVATPVSPAAPDASADTCAPLRFITCGSVDDGKSTLIGRLLLDAQAVLQDQLASVQRMGQPDLALLTDGLSAEREQGITIDVAWRYFSTPARPFIIGDTPGHAQYTRNMVTAASVADAAIVLVDATKLHWAQADTGEAGDAGHGELLEQTRRHLLLLKLLRVPAIGLAVNKLDAVAHPDRVFSAIRDRLLAFSRVAEVPVSGVFAISALLGHNVVRSEPGWCGQPGSTLLEWLESLPVTAAPHEAPAALPVQWVEKFPDAAHTDSGRRVFWGRLAQGQLQPGSRLRLFPGGQEAVVARVLDAVRRITPGRAGTSVGVVLDRELDCSRGDWLLEPGDNPQAGSLRAEGTATVAWMDEEPLVPGRVYWALHGHRWIKARVSRILARRNLQTLALEPAGDLQVNSIGEVELTLQQPIVWRPFAESRPLGAMILVDTASHRTAGALMLGAHPAGPTP